MPRPSENRAIEQFVKRNLASLALAESFNPTPVTPLSNEPPTPGEPPTSTSTPVPSDPPTPTSTPASDELPTPDSNPAPNEPPN
jgi:hypothetical protein